jgi:hypothetical protein
MGYREGFLSKGVSVALWLLLFKGGKALVVFWVSRELSHPDLKANPNA